MNNTYKVIAGIFALFATAWGAYAGLNKLYTPREVYTIEMAAMSQQFIQMQRNSQASHWLNQRFYWQQRVEQLQYECGLEPWNQNKKALLQEAKNKRDYADREYNRIQRQ
jgi:hypothetical protein